VTDDSASYDDLWSDIAGLAHGLRSEWLGARTLFSEAGDAIRARATGFAHGILIQPDLTQTDTDVETRGMSLRVGGRGVETTPRGLAAAYPSATGQLVVFVHGLADTEWAWFHRELRHRNPKDGEAPAADYGSRLGRDLACSAVYVRYNSGRHISDSGADLVRLLSDLVHNWPTTVREIVLIGHSLGGLVVRSAIYQAQFAKLAWLPRVTGVVCLGTPHAGAPIGRATAWTATMLGRSSVTAPLSRLLNLRSGAIKDLAYGYLHEYQWSTESNGLPSKNRARLMKFPARLPQLFVYATVSRSVGSRWGRVVGDLLVGAASAGTPDGHADLRWIGGLNHVDLLHHDSVYDAILSWLRNRRCLAGAAGAAGAAGQAVK
jgi:pimeloyl-ACP methyl ester carboxylesterase